MAKESINAKQLTGMNIYHTKNQTIYLNPLNKTAYIITNSVLNKWSAWSMRLPGVLFATCLLIVIGINPIFAVIIGLIAYIVITIIFYTKFLPSLAINTNFKKPASEGFIRDMAKKFELSSLLFISVCSLIFAFISLFNAFRQSEVATAFNMNLVFGLVFLIIGLFFGFITYIKKKENIKEN